MTFTERRISTAGYQALREALPAIVWYKKNYERYLRTALRSSPELLDGLDFDETKRRIADALVDRLVQQEQRYHGVTLQLMLETAGLTDFPDLKSHENSEVLLAKAGEAVAELKLQTERHSALLMEREMLQARSEVSRRQVDLERRFEGEIDHLRRRYDDMVGVAAGGERSRGKQFEVFLHDLFDMFDLEPRLDYALPREQIDGAFTFDTDDYIMEAKWLSGPVSREQADVFAAKVRRKGKNALGLFVSVNGFTGPALAQYSEGTPFMTMDGADLYAVLDRRVRLDDLLRRKRRHANETGECFYPAHRMFA